MDEEELNNIARVAVGIGAVKYADLSKKQNHRLYFRLGSDVKFFEGNAAPYIQYAHTPCCCLYL